jgi:hypothetical protein
MTDQSHDAAPAEPEQLREEIERTRQEMSATVDAIADKVNVKAKASDAVAGAKQKVVDGAVRAKESAPPPVQNALDKAGEKAGPVVHQVSEQVAPHRDKVIMGGAGLVLVLLVLRRRRARTRRRAGGDD